MTRRCLIAPAAEVIVKAILSVNGQRRGPDCSRTPSAPGLYCSRGSAEAISHGHPEQEIARHFYGASTAL